MTIFSYLNDPTSLLLMVCIRLVVIFMILPVHEFAHAWAAKKMGDNTAQMMGRLTINPLAHLDLYGALFLILFGFGWAKPVPINPRNFKNYKKGMILTAAAGPLSNLICAAIGMFASYVVLALFAYSGFGLGSLFDVFYILSAIYEFGRINIALAVFNLIPIPPLDGSKVFGSLLPAKVNLYMYKYQTYIYIGFLVLLFTGVLDTPMTWIINLISKLLGYLFFWVGPLMKALFE